jgi:hypothetical protein
MTTLDDQVTRLASQIFTHGVSPMNMLQRCGHRKPYGGAKVAAEKRHPAGRRLRTTGPLLLVVAGCLSFASQASEATTCGTSGVLSAVGNVLTCTYTMSGEDTFNPPLFVTTVHVVAVGQTGGIGSAYENLQAAGAPGAGARVAASLPVTQPTLFVEVPPSPFPLQKGAGCVTGGQQTVICGGGGGGSGDAPGGGASVVQTCSVSSSCVLTGNPLTDPRLVVAAGGGGGFNGSDVLISHPQVIAPNTHLTVGQISVNLNEQTPFTLPADKGLIVDAIQISVGPPSSVTAHLTVASSESDIGGLSGTSAHILRTAFWGAVRQLLRSCSRAPSRPASPVRCLVIRATYPL